MAANTRSTSELQALEDALQRDPNYQRLQAQSYATPMLRDSALRDYALNDPRSPLYGLNREVEGGAASAHGSGAYNLENGALKWSPIGATHWYTDPKVMGPVIVGAASAGLGAYGAAGGAGSAGGSVPTTMNAAGLPVNMSAAATAGMNPISPLAWAAASGAGKSVWDRVKGAGKGAGNVAKGAGNVAEKANPFIQAALAALSGVPALLANKGPSDEEKRLYEEARQMQQLQRQRLESQNPLFQAVTQLAMQRLPTGVQR